MASPQHLRTTVHDQGGFTLPKTIQIYMDWANHYLEKARHNKFITDLQHDVSDGVLLADVIEAVTNEKIKDIKQKPKNSAQMVENINTCLTFLATLGVSVDGISAKDIKEGNLKTILGLFFSLSRYKQQQKCQQREQAAHAKEGTLAPTDRGGCGGGPGGREGEDRHGGRTATSHVLTEDARSRLPSPARGGGNKSAVSGISSNRDVTCRNGRSQTNASEKGRSHANQQNPLGASASGSSIGVYRGAAHSNSGPQATPPSSSGIPTAVGRGHPGSGGEKQSHRTSAGSTSSNSSCKSSSSKPPTTSSPSNKNSMLDKFKFFNKDKDKKGASKGASKSGGGSGSDVKAGGSSSEAAAGAAGHGSSPATTAVPRSSSSSKVGKKSGARAFSSKQEDGQEEDNSRVASPSPSVHQVSILSGSRSSSPNPSALPTFSPGQTRRLAGPSATKPERPDPHSSPKLSKKSSKLATFIPTKPTSTPTASKPRSSNAGVSPPVPAALSQAPPTPTAPPPPLTSAIPTGIPKPQSSKSGGKVYKEDKPRSKDNNKALYSPQPTPSSPTGLAPHPTKTSPQQHVPLTQQQLQRHQLHLQQLQLQQQKQQQQQQQHKHSSRSRHHEPSSSSYSEQNRSPTFSTFSPPTPTIQDEPGYANVSEPSSSVPTSSSLSKLVPSSSSHSMQGGHARVNMQNLDMNGVAESGSGRLKTQSLERQKGKEAGEGQYLPKVGRSAMDSVPASPVRSPSVSRHAVSPGSSAAVNVVKPTSHTKATKTDSNTQTNLSVLKKSSTHKAVEGQGSHKMAPGGGRASPKMEQETERSSPKMHRRGDRMSPRSDRSSPKRALETAAEECAQSPSSRSSPAPSRKTMGHASPVKPLASDFSSAAQMKNISSPTTTNSPRLGVKMLNSHHGKPANNVAIVQPHHGEKIETTFDTEVRTETRQLSSKETTFPGNEGKTTFVDDTGEAMDIKPMQPIMRALPYGYFRGYTGYTGLSNSRNFHIPGISVPPAAVYPARAQSHGFGVNRSAMEPGKFHSGPTIQRANSTGASVSNDTDYSSDMDTYDYVSGYMSDGDILKSNSRNDDWSSGYLSEGGASLYARRLQQRFREGMQAVKECMQKSSGLIDDDSFDDSSSVSSGDISDTIAEISTDENLTGSSQGALSDSQVYTSLKRMPPEVTRGFMQHGQPLQESGKRTPSLGTSAFMGSDYYSDSGFGGNTAGWRKYSLPPTNKLLSSDPSDYGYPYSLGAWTTRSDQQEYSAYRKLSTASHPEFSPIVDSGYGDSERTFMRGGEHAPSPGPGTKRDSETNTDQSHLMDASLRQRHTARAVHNGTPPSQGSGSMFGYRRPLSNTSTSSSMGSGKSSGGSIKGSPVVGSRLARHGMEGVSQMVRSGSDSVAHTPTSIPRPASASSARSCHSDMGSEGYRSSTLERKQHTGITPSKSTGAAGQADFQSNSLGRRRLFGSKGSLSQKSAEGGVMCDGTIISNPHASYTKDGAAATRNLSHYVNLQELHGRQHSNYVPLEFPSQRHSGGSATGATLGPSLWHRNSQSNIPAPSGQEGESTDESVLSSSIQQQIQQARAMSGLGARILQQHREVYAALSAAAQASPCPSPTLTSNPILHRSDSAKSDRSLSKLSGQEESLSSESLHLNVASVSDLCDSSNEASTPASPSPSDSPFTCSLNLASGAALGEGTGGGVMVGSQTGVLQSVARLGQGKEDSSCLPKSSTMGDYAYFSDYAYLSSVHGSNLSLVSTSSSHSVYSSAEEKHAAEVRKLRRDLESAQSKVHTLTSQLSTNAHVVSAFEQSLANMTARLQALTSSSEQKDSELNDLRVTIEALRRQSGLAMADPTIISPAASRRHTSPAMVSKDLHSVVMESGAGIARQISSDSVSSINSLSSACSMTSQHSAATDGEGRRGSKSSKKKGWLRSSFSKAFSGKKPKKIKTGSFSEMDMDAHCLRSNASAPNSPLMQIGHMPGASGTLKSSHSSGALSDADVGVLKQQLREKDAKLTDIRLEALSSAHQLEQLRETMTKMKNEMSALKADNDRLHKLMSTSRTINFTQALAHARTTSTDSLDRSLSLTDQSSLDMLLAETAANDRDGKRVTITVYQGSNPDPSRPGPERPAEVLIGSLSVSGKTKWDILDNIVRKIFKEYVLRVDPVTNLGLSAESVFSYHIGEITRTKDSEVPELLPIGYLVGDTTQIGICLKGTRQQSVDSLAFETMIPKSIIQRYVSLLLEHRRIILCGPSGTGKTYLAQKLAEHLVLRSGKELTAGCVAVFNVDHKSAKELRQYLANIADQCEATSVNALPSVVILDNLHHVASLAEVFNGFLTAKYQKCPYIIGTMNQSTCSTTNLQLHHNFRWVLCANHMEPVKGFLGRYLRRKLVEAEVHTGVRNNDLNRTIDWIPKVWAHINKFLETHSSSDVTIGPRLFLSCPMDMAGSQVWFTDLWNYSIVPYIIEAVRDGLQVYGKRAPWEDPTDWSMQTYPWSNLGCERHLLPIRPEDVGYDTVAPPPTGPVSQMEVSSNKKSSSPASKEENVISSESSDPLVSMLKKLHETPDYPDPNVLGETTADSGHGSTSPVTSEAEPPH